MSDIADSDIFDVASVICCGGILLCYHLYTYAQVFLFDNHVIQLKKTFDVAPAWIDKHLEKEDPASVTLAVQTLRNTILISIFLGGNSFSYAFSILSQIKNETRTIDSAVSAIISSVLFLSFLNWAAVIRCASHLGFYIGGTKTMFNSMRKLKSMSDIENNDISVSQVTVDESIDCKRLARRMLQQFSFGFRFIFLSIPFTFFYLNAIAMIVTTVILLLMLVNMDYVEINPIGRIQKRLLLPPMVKTVSETL